MQGEALGESLRRVGAVEIRIVGGLGGLVLAWQAISRRADLARRLDN